MFSHYHCFITGFITGYLEQVMFYEPNEHTGLLKRTLLDEIENRL